MQTEHTLFDEFSPASKEEWKKQVRNDLKGAEYNEQLFWQVEEGLWMEPIYELSETEQLHYQTALQQAGSNSEGQRSWRNRQQITAVPIAVANRKALEALNNGADEVAFDLSGQQAGEIDLALLLNEVLLPYCAVSFIVEASQAVAFIQKYLDFARQHYDLASLSGSLELSGAQADASLAAALLKAGAEAPGFKVLNLAAKSEISTASGQLARLLADAVGLINHTPGVAPAQVMQQLVFTLEGGNAYFLEIARLRALRLLFSGIARQYGVQQQPLIHSRSHIRRDEKTQQDPYLNMLSNTTQAMAALIGGCDVLTVLPHNKGIAESDSMAERVARNVSNILREESYMDKVIDPAAGSFYVEKFTAQLAEAAWEAFKKLI